MFLPRKQAISFAPSLSGTNITLLESMKVTQSPELSPELWDPVCRSKTFKIEEVVYRLGGI